MDRNADLNQSVVLDTRTLPAAMGVEVFPTRPATLEPIQRSGARHLAEEESCFLSRRLNPDMPPLGTQIAFTFHQPRTFALWLA